MPSKQKRKRNGACRMQRWHTQRRRVWDRQDRKGQDRTEAIDRSTVASRLGRGAMVVALHSTPLHFPPSLLWTTSSASGFDGGGSGGGSGGGDPFAVSLSVCPLLPPLPTTSLQPPLPIDVFVTAATGCSVGRSVNGGYQVKKLQ